MAKVRGIFLLIYFLGAAIVGSLIILLRDYKGQQALAVFKRLSYKTLAFGNICVALDGEEQLPVSGGYVMVYNENSWPDVIALQALLYNDFIDRSAAASEYGKLPFMKKACQAADIALVPRGDRVGVDRVLNDLTDSLKAGKRIAFGGEGRLSGIDGVLRFKVGSALLAIRSQKPLIPIAFYGSHHLMPLKTMALRAGIIRVRFGAPILTQGLTEDNARELADKAQQAVTELYQSLAAEQKINL